MELVNFETKTRKGDYEKNIEPTSLIITDVRILNKTAVH